MNPLAVAALLGALGGSPSYNDGLTPPDMPPTYRAECGTCHVPYPPNLLSAGGVFSGAGWWSIMSNLRTHYGEDATLDEPTRRQIEQYLVDNAAASQRRFGSRADPARLTSTLWFRRSHGVAKAHFADKRVGSPANCLACHPQAEDWRFARKDVVLPEASGR